MAELTWVIDPTTGDLAVEGLATARLAALADDLLPPGLIANCARPAKSMPLMADRSVPGVTLLQVARIYHGSVVDGPGRRSVLQLQGCPIRCPGCYVPDTQDPHGGLSLRIDSVVAALLDPSGEPRAGVTILGGEPFFQLVSLQALLDEPKLHGVHTVVYSGYTLEALARRKEPEIHHALRSIDLLIDGPYVAALSEDAGEWRGSRNQRIISNPSKILDIEKPAG